MDRGPADAADRLGALPERLDGRFRIGVDRPRPLDEERIGNRIEDGHHPGVNDLQPRATTPGLGASDPEGRERLLGVVDTYDDGSHGRSGAYRSRRGTGARGRSETGEYPGWGIPS